MSGLSPSPGPASKSQPALLTFLADVEVLIRQAGHGKHDISTATAGIRSGEMSRSEAAALVNGVIANRQDVLSQLKQLSQPTDPDAAACLHAFKNAMRYSL